MASRRSHLTLIALMLAALAGVALIGVPGSPFHKSIRKGLDLQGGLEVVLQAKPPPGQVLTAAEMTNSINIMRTRIDKLGVSEPVVTKQGTNQIVIELPAVHNINQAAQIIGKTAVLELYDLTPSLLPPSIGAGQNPVAIPNLFDLLTRVQTGQHGNPTAAYLIRTKTKRIVAGPAEGLGLVKREALVKTLLKPYGGKLPKGTQVLYVPPKATVITCDSTVAVVCPGLTSAPAAGVTYYYLFKHGNYPNDTENPYPQMTGKDLKLSGTQQDFDPSSGQPIVTMQFTGHGNKLFHEITREEAVRGQTLGNQQSFGIVLDDQLYSFPTINYPSCTRAGSTRPPAAPRSPACLALGGEAPRARPADGRAAGQVRHDRAHRRLGDARQGLAEAGAQRRDRRPDRRRHLPAPALPLPRPRRRDRPRDLLRVHVRRDPALWASR